MIPDDDSFRIPDAEAGLRCVDACIEGDALAEALTLLEGLHWRFPDNGCVTRQLADVLLDLEEPVRALALLEAEVRREPLESLNYGFLGDALKSLGRLAEAEAAYRSALALDPGYARAARELCDLRAGRGDHAGAHRILNGLLDMDPLDPFNHGYLGELLAREGHLAEAEEAFRTALWLRPAYSWAGCELAALLCRTSRPAEAREILERSLARGADGRVLACLAQVEYRLGLRERAAITCRRALEVAPELATALEPLRHGFAAAGSAQEAARDEGTACDAPQP